MVDLFVWEWVKKKLPFVYTAIIFFMVGAFAGNVWFNLQMGTLG